MEQASPWVSLIWGARERHHHDSQPDCFPRTGVSGSHLGATWEPPGSMDARCPLWHFQRVRLVSGGQGW